jgi:DNA repair exonuclease SbcCD ATPase subunit
MKTIRKSLQTVFCATVLFILMGLNVFSQEVIEVKNSQAQMSKGMQPCYVVEIPQADLKTVQQNWIKKLQEGNKTKIKEVGQELVLSGVVKSEFTKDTANFYSLLIQKDSLISLNVFVEFDSVFFSPKEDKTDLASDKIDNSIINYLRTFAVDQYKIAVADELKGEQKMLETKQDDLEKLEKDEENMIKEISSLENDIDKTEREIKEIEAKIDLKNQEILTHNASMMTIAGETEKKAAQEKQKDLEKERKKMEKERSNAKDDISSYKSKIEKNNKDIEKGKQLQEEKKEEITKQTEVVTQVQAKLNGIK